MDNSRRIFPIQARWFVLLWLAPSFYLPGLGAVYTHAERVLGAELLDESTYDILFYFYYYTLFSLCIITAFRFSSVQWRNFYTFPARSSTIRGFTAPNIIRPSVEITVFNLVASIALIYLIFWPLSYLSPEFIQYWYIDLPPIVYYSEAGFPILANTLNLLSLVVLAPIIEETVFRGILLQRWSSKYGSVTAILLSSVLFGLAHTDALGAFLFGLFMSLLFIRSRTLLLPILAHSLYNTLAWLIELISTLYTDPNSVYTLLEFQASWPFGLVAVLAACVWWFRLSNKIPSLRTWSVPAI